MKILHLTAGAMFGGVESLALTLTQAKEYGSGLVSHFGVCFEGELTQRLSERRVPWRNLGVVSWSRPWTMWKANQRLREWIQSEKFDAFVCHSCWPHAIFSRTLRRTQPKTPLYFWIHDQPTGHWLEKLSRFIPPKAVIAGSSFIGSQAPLIFPKTPVQIAHIPVVDHSVAESDRGVCRSRIRQELNTPESTRVLILVGRMAELKGYDVLLQALDRLQRRPGFTLESPWRLWIVGAPQNAEEEVYFQNLQHRVESAGLSQQVQFLGFRKDVPELLSAADWYCQPNILPESFGISFVEALYAGLPVLTSEIGGGKEIVTSDCGLLSPPNDPTGLEACLRKVLGPGAKDLSNTLRPNCRSRARKLCDPVQQFLRIEKILQS